MGIPAIRLTSPRGRLVQGDAFTPNTTDAQNQPLVVKTGPNAGQPRKEWFMALAFPKSHPETMPYLMELAKYAAQAWPTFFPQGATQVAPSFGCSHPRFSFKIADGDGVDDNGKPNASKPGWAGHWIVKYSTGVQAPGVWQEPNYDPMAQITDARALPRGYFVRIAHGVQSNENDQRPGLYVNLNMVSICADQQGAEVIQSGPSAADAFGGGTGGGIPSAPSAPAPVTPAAAGGVVTAPNSPHTVESLRASGWSDEQMIASGFAVRAAPLPVAPPAAPPVPVPTPAASTPMAPATPSPSNAAPPYAGFMQPGVAGSPVVPVPPVTTAPPPAGPSARVMTPAAGGQTYEAMIAAGWTDAMLIQHGMMVA